MAPNRMGASAPSFVVWIRHCTCMYSYIDLASGGVRLPMVYFRILECG